MARSLTEPFGALATHSSKQSVASVSRHAAWKTTGVFAGLDHLRDRRVRCRLPAGAGNGSFAGSASLAAQAGSPGRRTVHCARSASLRGYRSIGVNGPPGRGSNLLALRQGINKALRSLTATCRACAHRHRGEPVLGPAGRTRQRRRSAMLCIRTTAAGLPG